jgi:hypothetical protein
MILMPFCMSSDNKAFGHLYKLREFNIFQIASKRFPTFFMAINYLKKIACVVNIGLLGFHLVTGHLILFKLVCMWQKTWHLLQFLMLLICNIGCDFLLLVLI